MQQLDNYISRNPAKVFFFLLALAVPAFFTNLGLLPLFADEPTRANVAMEMILSKNFSVPTIGGEYYYNKPPLYNWILAGFYLLTGSFSEFVTRLPAIIPLFLFAITIYYSVVYFLQNKHTAVLAALFCLLNGRMLLYDSMLGHIDIFYSWLTFSSFMLIFFFYQRKQWFLLFFVSYIITAITFLCKGLPSIVFQGLTIIALLAYTKNFKKFFSWQHILSGIFCLLLIGLYFYNYSLQNSNIEGYFDTIWNQSSQRTVAATSAWKTIKYVLLFPFEHVGHLFPASLLMLFCLRKSFWKELRQNEFLHYISIIFLANIWVYWLSPETRPRYLLMLYPLLFIIWSHAYYTWRDKLPKINKLLETVLLISGILVILAIPAIFFVNLKDIIDFLYLKTAVVFISLLICTYLIWKLKSNKIIAFAALLIIVRLGFSWFILPYRLHKDDGAYFRQSAIEMGTISKQKPFYFYQYHPQILSVPFHDKLIFYIERTRMQKVKFTETDTKPGYYFTFDRNLNTPNSVLIKTYRGNLKLFEVK